MATDAVAKAKQHNEVTRRILYELEDDHPGFNSMARGLEGRIARGGGVGPIRGLPRSDRELTKRDRATVMGGAAGAAVSDGQHD